MRFTPRNTITIASSISNGAAAALLAAEQDTKGLISGVAVTEPQIQPNSASGYTVRQGGAPVSAQGKSLFDYATYAALYQPCIAGSARRCSALFDKGLLAGADLAARQSDAIARLRAYGWLADSDPLQAAHVGTNILVAVTYAYGKFSVTDKVCGASFSPTDAAGDPIAMSAAQRAASFATQNGIIGSVLFDVLPSVNEGDSHYWPLTPERGTRQMPSPLFSPKDTFRPRRKRRPWTGKIIV